MAKKNYNVVGVMSGTSLDGIDLAFAKISLDLPEEGIYVDGASAEIITATTLPYSKEWVQKLSEAVDYSEIELGLLNDEYTAYLAAVINDFLNEEAIPNLDAICSHGHTILHQPDQGKTLQIGNLPKIANLLNHRVVCDFRVQDVTLGGQGAPLVPIGDRLLFNEYDYCLNLGGFANLSLETNGSRIAYDICPVNTVLNIYAQQLGEAYDDGGAFAKAGTVDIPLLEQLNALPFYTQAPPKSLGIEWVQAQIFPLLTASQLSPKDLLATFTEHVALQLAAQFESEAKVLISGGGAYNSFLIERLKEHKNINAHIPDRELIEFKEALVFALLGVLKIEKKVNCLASVTGAAKDHSSGLIFQP